MASLLKVPCIFMIENNLMAMGTQVERHSAVTDLSQRAAGYNMPSRNVDAMDVDTVIAELGKAVERGRNRVSSVDTVNRDGDGWRVSGEVNGGRDQKVNESINEQKVGMYSVRSGSRLSQNSLEGTFVRSCLSHAPRYRSKFV